MAPRRSRWIREEQLRACLDNVSSLCSAHLEAVARACALVERDAHHPPSLHATTVALAALATAEGAHGENVLRLTVVRRTLSRMLDDGPALCWLARAHPEALAVFIAVTDPDLVTHGD